MADDPILMLIHGAWLGGWLWEPVLGPLRERGVHFEVIERLPSAGSHDEIGDLRGDAKHVDARLSDIAAPVVLCGHSYGGMVITELADHPAVRHSIYLAAFFPGPGQSLFELVGTPPEWIVDRGDGRLVVTDDAERARLALFSDLDAERAAQAQAQLVPQSVASFAQPSSAPARAHPTTYVLCTNDRAIPPPAQEAMSAGADTTIRMQSDHCPQLSHPETLADVLAGVLAPEYG